MSNSSHSVCIAQVSTFFSGVGGGAVKAIADHMKAVKSQGIRAVLFTGYHTTQPLTPATFNVERFEIVASRVVGPSFSAFPLQSLRALNRRAQEFDLIHLNGAWNITSFLAGAIARANKKPYIMTPHCHYGEYHFRRYAPLKRILYSLLERRTLKHAACVHLVSKWEQRTSRHALGQAPVTILPYAVDVAPLMPPAKRREARMKLGLDQRAMYIMAFGRIARQKDPLFLLNAFMAADLPVDAKLAFIGPGEPDLLRAISQFVHMHQLQDRVILIDFVEGAEKKYWLSAADIFALPSHDDNFCIAALEAAVCGALCLLSPHIGVVEYMPEESYRIEPKTVDAWSVAIRQLYASRPEQHPLPLDYLAPLKSESIGRRWAQVYKTLLPPGNKTE